MLFVKKENAFLKHSQFFQKRKVLLHSPHLFVLGLSRGIPCRHPLWLGKVPEVHSYLAWLHTMLDNESTDFRQSSLLGHGSASRGSPSQQPEAPVPPRWKGRPGQRRTGAGGQLGQA